MMCRTLFVALLAWLVGILPLTGGIPTFDSTATGLPVAGKPASGEPVAYAPARLGSLIDLSAKAKIDTALAFIGKLQHRVSDGEFIRLRDQSDSLFTTSGYINLESAGGQHLRLTRGEFLTRARDRQAAYKLKKATLVLNDLFRKGPNDRWYCRSTTFHEVSRFDGDYPIPEKVTSVKRKPVRERATSESYWQIIELTLTEK
ncbi:hypothetical protein [Dyadobacter fermentans]|uniref:hypothetical protein n=1 Tax=Dyadobacter fermentans TaxID=94254 RepID=UPI001CBF5960|nr:hypothetical protein [Dyadobacter fermentans]MBZ1361591.1 hypothetical protein [Dyadobacter fermentans]